MSVLPWKITTEKVSISDSFGNTLPGVPKYGSLTLDEIEMIKQWQTDETFKGLDPIGYAKLIVCGFFRYRLKLSESISDDEILTGPDGQQIPTSLLTAIFEFFWYDEAGVAREVTESVPEKKQLKLIGVDSSSNSKSTIQTVKSSNQEILEESPLTSSGRRSKSTKKNDSEALNLPVAQ